MREIKFRVWDGKLMNDVAELIWTVAYGKWYGPGVGSGIFWIDEEFDNWEGSPETVDSILMQYTGLKDKNEKEIYEGDKINGAIPTEQYRHENGAIEWDNDCAQFTVIFQPDKDTTIDVPLYMFDELEIIGNIYENPKLGDK